MWVGITSIVEQTMLFMMALAFVVYFIMHSHEVHARKQHRFIWDRKKAIIQMNLAEKLPLKLKGIYSKHDWELIVDTYFHVECMMVLRSLITMYQNECITRKHDVHLDSREWSFYTSQMVLHNTLYDRLMRQCNTQNSQVSYTLCCAKPAILSEWLYTNSYTLFTGVVVPTTSDAQTPLLMLQLMLLSEQA